MRGPPLRRLAGAALLAGYAAAVGASALAGPLGVGGAAVWPFNRAWWVFSAESGRAHRLRVIARFDDGRRDEVDLAPWFAWPASRRTLRYDELPRDEGTLRALAAWACARHNREAPAAERWSALSVSDTSWPHARGAWRTLAEAPYAERREVDVLFDEPCPARAR